MTFKTTAITPFRIDVPQADLDDLQDQLTRRSLVRRAGSRDRGKGPDRNEFDRGSRWATQDAPDLVIADICRFFGELK
ncbi:hypothetical protein [Nocardia anaemiae]|uniref:hypothetical protein n=1 Tax=Nocardia anaemiae TaxID=263910 RepID=UPI0007A3AB2B|nr:hypothetical protein [Nocardia anaemiae]